MTGSRSRSRSSPGDPRALQGIPRPFGGSPSPPKGDGSSLLCGSRQLEQSDAAPAKRGAARSHLSCQARRNRETAGLAGKTLTKEKREKPSRAREEPQPGPGRRWSSPSRKPTEIPLPAVAQRRLRLASPPLPSPQPPRPGRRLTARLASPHRRLRPRGSPPGGCPAPALSRGSPLA